MKALSTTPCSGEPSAARKIGFITVSTIAGGSFLRTRGDESLDMAAS